MAEDIISSLSDEDYNHIIGMIKRGEDTDWLEPGFANIIGKRALTSGDTASFNTLKLNFPTIAKPPPIIQPISPSEIVSGMMSPKTVPVLSKKQLPANLVSLKDYTNDFIQNIADVAGTGPIEGLPFMEDYTIETDWWQEAINHIEISPNSKYYEKFKDKKIRPADKSQRRLLSIARGKGDEDTSKVVRGKSSLLPAPYGVHASDKKIPFGTIRLTASDGKKGFTEEIPLEDIVINQEKFFRQFSGLGVPTKKGEVKISPRSSNFAHRLLFGGKTHPMQEPRGNKFVALEKEDGSLYWSRAPSTTIQGR